LTALGASLPSTRADNAIHRIAVEDPEGADLFKGYVEIESVVSTDVIIEVEGWTA